MSHVFYRRNDLVGVIELNRPPANSYDITFMRALDVAISQAESDAECKVVIVRSTTPGFFCGGADIKIFRANSAQQNMEMIAFAHETLNRPSQSNKIYIAEIAGHALGGGLEIALACDFRFAASGKFQLGLPEVKLGILPGNGGTQRLSHIIGFSRALELMITGDTFSPETAHVLGVVNRLYDEDALEAATYDFAHKLAVSATVAVANIKRSVYDGYLAALQAGMALERKNIAALFSSSDAAEGFAAFAERRSAVFKGQ